MQQREVPIAELAKRALIARHDEFAPSVPMNWRSELEITLPDHGQFTTDLVYQLAAQEDEFGVCECKWRWNKTLHEQIDRWAGYVHYRWVGFEQRKNVRIPLKQMLRG